MTLGTKLREVTWSMVLLICMVASIGFAVLYSAAHGNADPWMDRQMARFGIGLILMLAVAMVDLRQLMKIAYPLYGISFLLLIYVDVAGHTGMGATRWIDLKFIQLQIALGSGGMFGKGFLQGSQSHLDFLPEHQTDFIFITFAEEFGMVGGVVLLGLYSLLVLYGMVIALRSRSHFGRIVAFGLAANLFLYFFINTAMVMGIIPVVGVPLPLISYGGTAMITVMMGFGLIISVYIHRDMRLGRRSDED